MRYLVVVFWVLFAVPVWACDVDGPFELHVEEACAEDVKLFLERVSNCMHFGGEPGYDAERLNFLQYTMLELRCDQLPCDRDDLLKKYKGDAVNLGVIDQFFDVVYGEHKAWYLAQDVCVK